MLLDSYSLRNYPILELERTIAVGLFVTKSLITQLALELRINLHIDKLVQDIYNKLYIMYTIKSLFLKIMRVETNR